MKNYSKRCILLFTLLVMSGIGFGQSYQEIMAQRVYWPRQVTLTKGFSAQVVTSDKRSMGEVSFTAGRSLGYTGPYQKKAGFMVIKVGSSFALAPIDHTDFIEQIKAIKASGQRDVRPSFNQGATATPGAPASGASTAQRPGPQVPGARPLLEMKVVKGKANRHDKTDYDNQSQNVVMKVQIRSREFTRQYQGAEAKIYVLAKSAAANMKDRAYKMITAKTMNFDLMPGKTYSFESDSVALQYDDNESAKFGDKFYGYLLEIYEDGKLITSQSSPSTLKKYADQVRGQSVSKAGYYGTYFRLN